jgi:hypothetical protein
MFVTHLDYDEWAAEVLRPGYLHREIAHPDWEQIEATIRALDGVAQTEVALRASNENPADTPHMMIGGGNEGRYIAYATYDGRRLFDLHRSGAGSPTDDEDMRVVVGGQEGIYYAREVVDLATVLVAARAFALDGELAPELNWDAH